VRRLSNFFRRGLVLPIVFVSFLLWAPPYDIPHQELAQQTVNSLNLRGDRGLLNFLPYSTNVPLIFAQAAPFIQALGLDATELSQREVRNVHSVEYLGSENVDAVEPANKDIYVFEIESAFENVPDGFYKKSLVESLNFFNQQHRQEFFFKSKEMSHAFFHLVPFLYDESGVALYENLEVAKKQVFERISQMTPSQLRELFLRPLATHSITKHTFSPVYDHIFTSDELEERREFITRFNNFRDVYGEREIPRYMYFRPRRMANSDKIKFKPDFVALTEVSPLEALLRGEWAGDCSTESLAYYALHPRVKVFKLSNATKNSDGIQGYVFVLEIDHDGKTLPYILTMNAKLVTKQHIALASEIVARIYKVDSVLLPHFSDDYRMTDNPEVKALYSSAKSENVKVNIPADWFQIDTLQKEFKDMAHANPYAGKRIQHARLVNIAELAARGNLRILRTLSSKVHSSVQAEAPMLKHFSRALLAHQHLLATGGDPEAVAHAYGNSEQDLHRIRRLLVDAAPHAEGIEEAIKTLGIEADHFRAFPIQRQLLLFSILLKNNSSLLTDSKWSKAAKSALALADKIDKDLARSSEYTTTASCLAKLRGD